MALNNGPANPGEDCNQAVSPYRGSGFNLFAASESHHVNEDGQEVEARLAD